MHHSGRRKSITRKISVLLVLMLMVQCGLFMAAILFGGTVGQLQENAVSILAERTLNRKNDLENEMKKRWSDLRDIRDEMQEQVNFFLQENQLTTEQLLPNDPKTDELLEQLATPLLILMSTNEVNGAFVSFLGEEKDRPQQGVEQKKAGLYFYDMDSTTHTLDGSDIFVRCGPENIIKNLDISSSEQWSSHIPVTSESNLYYNPIESAYQKEFNEIEQLGYWSFYVMHDGSNSVMTYSQPLLDQQGMPYGVLGIELVADYLNERLPSAELCNNDSGIYAIGVINSEQKDCYRIAVSNTLNDKTNLSAGSQLTIAKDSNYSEGYRYVSESTGQEFYASIQPLSLYQDNTGFEKEQWVLIGMVEKTDLFGTAKSIVNDIWVIGAMNLILVVAFSIGVGCWFSAPVRCLAKQVDQLDPTKPVHLPKSNILEIDRLSKAIENLSRDVAMASSSIDKITHMEEFSMAMFHITPEKGDLVEYTENFFALLNLPAPQKQLPKDEFEKVMNLLESFADPDESTEDSVLYHLHGNDAPERWVRCRITEGENWTIGILIDETKQIREKRRMEYERDYDVLTNLLNRRSFQKKLEQFEQQPASGYGAMIMMDLDNLKFINDTYGHDAGDDYIHAAGELMHKFVGENGFAARLSGDEFYLFLFGYPEEQSLKREIDWLKVQLSHTFIQLPNGEHYRLRASMGIAYYPSDSTSLTTLMRYADFAMYEAKHTVKGTIKQFNSQSYQRDAYLLHSRGELNRILDEQAVDYAFQPIVSGKTGKVFGYEALMRLRSDTLRSPLELLRIARAESKLAQVEILTWNNATKRFFSMPDLPQDCLLFINSVPTQIPEKKQLEKFKQAYGQYAQRIVMELNESDMLEHDVIQEKKRIAAETGIQIALDDFGAGYSTDSVLLTTKANFVKVDMSIIRNIDQDPYKQMVLHNLVQLCHQMGSEVIAEGIETEAELKTVLEQGADYVQGYLISKPSFVLESPSDQAVEAIQAMQKGKM